MVLYDRKASLDQTDLTYNLPVLLAALGVVVLGADELPGVAEALAPVGQVEGRGVTESQDVNDLNPGLEYRPVEGGVRVAGLLLDLLQPGALELRSRVTATEPTARLGGVLVIQLEISRPHSCPHYPSHLPSSRSPLGYT